MLFSLFFFCGGLNESSIWSVLDLLCYNYLPKWIQLVQAPTIILMKKYTFIEHFSIETLCVIFSDTFSHFFSRRFSLCDVMKSLFLSECVCCMPSDINITKCVLFIKISPAVCVKIVRAPIYWFQQIDWQFQIE